MGSDEQGRVGRLWVRACRTADAEDWTAVRFAAVELAVGPIALVDQLAEAMLVALCRRARRRGWDHVRPGRRGVAAEASVERLLDLVARVDEVDRAKRRAASSARVPPGWLARWRASCGLPLSEGYVVVVRARQVWIVPPRTEDLSA